MSVGAWVICAIDTEGRKYCWGYNGEGAIGNPDVELHASVQTPTRIEPDPGLIQLDVTRHGACGVDQEGALWCWGRVFEGSLENGEEICPVPGLGWSVACALQPSRVLDPVSGPVSYSATVAFTDLAACALDAARRPFCWGRSPYAGSPVDVERPTEVVSGIPFRKVEAGWRTTCGLSLSGSVYCWGWGHHGSLGDGVLESAPRWSPQRILEPGTVASSPITVNPSLH